MNTRAVVAQARTEIKLTLRRGESLIVTLAIPLGILVFFSKIDATRPAGYKHAVDFLVPGVLGIAVMSASMVSLAISTGFERRYGVLKRLGSTPLSRSGLLTAKTLTILALEVIQCTLILAVGVALGWSVPLGAIAAIGILLLGTIAFSGLGMLMAGTLRAEATLALANGLFLVLLFLGGMAYPLEKMPSFLRDLANALPAAALSECLHGTLGGPAGRAFPTGSLVVLIVWAIVLPVLAARRFRWEED